MEAGSGFRACGWRRCLLGLRDDALTVRQHAERRWCGGVGGAWLRCQWAVAGPGRASRRRAEQSSRRGRRAGGPLPTGTPGSPAPQLGVTVPGTPAVLQATLRGPPPAGTPSSPARQAARHAKQPGPTVRRDGARSTRGIAHHRRQSARIRSQQRRQVDAPAARELGCLGAAREAVRQIHRVRLRIKRGQQRMRCDRD